MKPNEIKAALVLRGISITSIAVALGVSQPAVSCVVSGSRMTPRIRAAIAKAIDKQVDEVFPPETKEAA